MGKAQQRHCRTLFFAVLMVSVLVSLGCDRTKAEGTAESVSKFIEKESSLRSAVKREPSSTTPLATAAQDTARVPRAKKTQAMPATQADTSVAGWFPRTVLTPLGLACVALVISLMLVLWLARTILSWRRQVDSGMEAVVPSVLLEDLTERSKSFSARLEAHIEKFGVLSQRNTTDISAQMLEVDKLLKRLTQELDRKDADNRILRSLLEARAHSAQIRKTIKLSMFVTALRTQVHDATLSTDAAFDFLSEELRDALLEHNIRGVMPPIGAPIDQSLLSWVEVISNSPTDSSVITMSHPVVSTVSAPAYIQRLSTGEDEVIQKARITAREREET